MGITLRDYTFLGATQSLCPECLTLVPAKIVERGGRVYFRKRCPTHGPREDFVCSDVAWWDRTDYSLPGKMPNEFGVEPNLGCPFDCGLCTACRTDLFFSYRKEGGAAGRCAGVIAIA